MPSSGSHAPERSAPSNLETLAPCDATGSGDWKDADYNVDAWLGESRRPSVDWKVAEMPALEPQVDMPDAATAPVRPTTGPKTIDLDAIVVPSTPV